eukprot:scaffold30664_cov72-Phaeocystis_antarctica.AAC.2
MLASCASVSSTPSISSRSITRPTSCVRGSMRCVSLFRMDRFVNSADSVSSRIVSSRRQQRPSKLVSSFPSNQPSAPPMPLRDFSYGSSALSRMSRAPLSSFARCAGSANTLRSTPCNSLIASSTQLATWSAEKTARSSTKRMALNLRAFVPPAASLSSSLTSARAAASTSSVLPSPAEPMTRQYLATLLPLRNVAASFATSRSRPKSFRASLLSGESLGECGSHTGSADAVSVASRCSASARSRSSASLRARAARVSSFAVAAAAVVAAAVASIAACCAAWEAFVASETGPATACVAAAAPETVPAAAPAAEATVACADASAVACADSSMFVAKRSAQLAPGGSASSMHAFASSIGRTWFTPFPLRTLQATQIPLFVTMGPPLCPLRISAPVNLRKVPVALSGLVSTCEYLPWMGVGVLLPPAVGKPSACRSCVVFRGAVPMRRAVIASPVLGVVTGAPVPGMRTGAKTGVPVMSSRVGRSKAASTKSVSTIPAARPGSGKPGMSSGSLLPVCATTSASQAWPQSSSPARYGQTTSFAPCEAYVVQALRAARRTCSAVRSSPVAASRKKPEPSIATWRRSPFCRMTSLLRLLMRSVSCPT